MRSPWHNQYAPPSGVALALTAVSVCACTLFSCSDTKSPDTAAMVARGKLLFKTHGCVTCHSPEGKPIPNAPVLAGILGTAVELESGESFAATREYIRQSIRNPGIGIRKGYPNQMPKPFNLKDDELDALVEYVLTFKVVERAK